MLAELQTSLAAMGVHSVVARNHRLVLRWNTDGPWGPSGLTDPQLHIFTPDGPCVATADGTAYHLATGQRYAANSPATAATLIRDMNAISLREAGGRPGGRADGAP